METIQKEGNPNDYAYLASQISLQDLQKITLMKVANFDEGILLVNLVTVHQKKRRPSKSFNLIS